MRSFVSFLAGAVTVGAVVAALAVGGLIDDDAPSSSTSAAAPSPPTASNNNSSDDEKGGAPADISELYKRVSPGVVFIQAGQTGTGSGFVLDKEGHIVTNDHVVEGSNQFQVVIGGNPEPIPARLMGQERPMRFTQAEKKGFFTKLFGG